LLSLDRMRCDFMRRRIDLCGASCNVPNALNKRIFLLLVLALGCATATPPTRPVAARPSSPSVLQALEAPPEASGGGLGVGTRLDRAAPPVERTPWTRHKTDNFYLYTDARDGVARDVLAHLERVRASYAQWFAVEPVPVELVLFATEVDYGKRFGATMAVHYDVSAGRQVIITWYGTGDARFLQIVDHALALRFVHAKFGALPEFLADGLATYFGAARLHEDRLYLGGPPIALGLDKEIGDIAPIEALFGVADGDSEDLPSRTRKISAWALIGYLLDESVWGDNAGARLRAWLSMTAHHGRDAKTLRDSFTDIYPERSLSDVEAGYRGHALGAVGTRRFQHFLAAPAQTAPSPESGPVPQQSMEELLGRARTEVRAPRALTARQVASLARWRDERPRNHMYGGAYWLAPKRDYGIAYSMAFLRDHAIDLELGRTWLGHYLTPRYRIDFEVDNARNMFTSLAFGPQLALMNETLGLEPKQGVTGKAAGGGTSFYHLGLGSEVAARIHLWRGLYLRGSVALVYKLASNLEDFCRDPRFSGDASCPDASRMAEGSLSGNLRLGAGFAW
jgi:hypothetical protein